MVSRNNFFIQPRVSMIAEDIRRTAERHSAFPRIRQARMAPVAPHTRTYTYVDDRPITAYAGARVPTYGQPSQSLFFEYQPLFAPEPRRFYPAFQRTQLPEFIPTPRVSLLAGTADSIDLQSSSLLDGSSRLPWLEMVRSGVFDYVDEPPSDSQVARSIRLYQSQSAQPSRQPRSFIAQQTPAGFLQHPLPDASRFVPAYPQWRQAPEQRVVTQTVATQTEDVRTYLAQLKNEIKRLHNLAADLDPQQRPNRQTLLDFLQTLRDEILQLSQSQTQQDAHIESQLGQIYESLQDIEQAIEPFNFDNLPLGLPQQLYIDATELVKELNGQLLSEEDAQNISGRLQRLDRNNASLQDQTLIQQLESLLDANTTRAQLIASVNAFLRKLKQLALEIRELIVEEKKHTDELQKPNVTQQRQAELEFRIESLRERQAVLQREFQHLQNTPSQLQDQADALPDINLGRIRRQLSGLEQRVPLIALPEQAERIPPPSSESSSDATPEDASLKPAKVDKHLLARKEALLASLLALKEELAKAVPVADRAALEAEIDKLLAQLNTMINQDLSKTALALLEADLEIIQSKAENLRLLQQVETALQDLNNRFAQVDRAQQSELNNLIGLIETDLEAVESTQFSLEQTRQILTAILNVLEKVNVLLATPGANLNASELQAEYQSGTALEQASDEQISDSQKLLTLLQNEALELAQQIESQTQEIDTDQINALTAQLEEMLTSDISDPRQIIIRSLLSQLEKLKELLSELLGAKSALAALNARLAQAQEAEFDEIHAEQVSLANRLLQLIPAVAPSVSLQQIQQQVTNLHIQSAQHQVRLRLNALHQALPQLSALEQASITPRILALEAELAQDFDPAFPLERIQTEFHAIAARAAVLQNEMLALLRDGLQGFIARIRQNLQASAIDSAAVTALTQTLDSLHSNLVARNITPSASQGQQLDSLRQQLLHLAEIGRFQQGREQSLAGFERFIGRVRDFASIESTRASLTALEQSILTSAVDIKLDDIDALLKALNEALLGSPAPAPRAPSPEPAPAPRAPSPEPTPVPRAPSPVTLLTYAEIASQASDFHDQVMGLPEYREHPLAQHLLELSGVLKDELGRQSPTKITQEELAGIKVRLLKLQESLALFILHAESLHALESSQAIHDVNFISNGEVEEIHANFETLARLEIPAHQQELFAQLRQAMAELQALQTQQQTSLNALQAISDALNNEINTEEELSRLRQQLDVLNQAAQNIPQRFASSLALLREVPESLAQLIILQNLTERLDNFHSSIQALAADSPYRIRLRTIYQQIQNIPPHLTLENIKELLIEADRALQRLHQDFINETAQQANAADSPIRAASPVPQFAPVLINVRQDQAALAAIRALEAELTQIMEASDNLLPEDSQIIADDVAALDTEMTALCKSQVTQAELEQRLNSLGRKIARLKLKLDQMLKNTKKGDDLAKKDDKKPDSDGAAGAAGAAAAKAEAEKEKAEEAPAPIPRRRPAFVVPHVPKDFQRRMPKRMLDDDTEQKPDQPSRVRFERQRRGALVPESSSPPASVPTSKESSVLSSVQSSARSTPISSTKSSPRSSGKASPKAVARASTPVDPKALTEKLAEELNLSNKLKVLIEELAILQRDLKLYLTEHAENGAFQAAITALTQKIEPVAARSLPLIERQTRFNGLVQEALALRNRMVAALKEFEQAQAEKTKLEDNAANEVVNEAKQALSFTQLSSDSEDDKKEDKKDKEQNQ